MNGMTADEYTFRMDEERPVLWAGERTYPAKFRKQSFTDGMPPDASFLTRFPDYRHETRQALVMFENQWTLSVVWGDATYSSNRMTTLREQPPFMEEPQLVEVGVLMPTPVVIPPVEFEVGGQRIEMPERMTELWGDPLAYVTVPEFHRVADLVMHLPTDTDIPRGEWEDVQGFCDLIVTAGLERTL